MRSGHETIAVAVGCAELVRVGADLGTASVDRVETQRLRACVYDCSLRRPVEGLRHRAGHEVMSDQLHKIGVARWKIRIFPGFAGNETGIGRTEFVHPNAVVAAHDAGAQPAHQSLQPSFCVRQVEQSGSAESFGRGRPAQEAAQALHFELSPRFEICWPKRVETMHVTPPLR